MELSKFCSQVESSNDLCGTGMVVDNGIVESFVVKHKANGSEIKIPVDAVKKCEWPVLYEVMVGRREPSVIQHMSRIVGYFSKIENWNPSKIGELSDRKKGDYEVEIKEA